MSSLGVDEMDELEAETVLFAIRLLDLIANDPLVRGTHRAAARQHLKKLQEPTTKKQLTASDFEGH